MKNRRGALRARVRLRNPLASIQCAGIPWEIGRAETRHKPVLDDLRARTRAQTDGGLRTGRGASRCSRECAASQARAQCSAAAPPTGKRLPGGA